MFKAISIFGLLIILATSVQAHHSRAMFDTEAPLTLEGVISKTSWRNPHVYFEIDAVNSEGQIETWVLESGAISGMRRRGWNDETLKVGDAVSIIVSPHVDSNLHYAALVEVSSSDGTQIARQAQTSNVETLLPSTDMSGTWTLAQTTNRDGATGNEAVSGPDHFPLTDKGLLQVQSFDLRDDPMFACVSYGVPRLAASVYSRRFTREDDRIVIQQEQYPVTRIVYLNDAAMPENFEPSPTGYSSGHFEADGKLVVETTGFSYSPWGSAAGLDSSEQKRIVEEYSLSEDGLTLNYMHTIFDAEFLTEPVIESWAYNKIPEREYIYDECDPELARIPIDFLDKAK
jgi:hypothetical protein